MGAPLRILFAGTPAFAVPPLEALLASPHRVEAVISQPDRPAGRGRRLQPPPVKQAALAAGIPVIQPERLAVPDLEAVARDGPPDLLVVVAFGQLLPAPVLDYPRHGALNVHASLLPRWRGAAPIARALLAGDGETGVSIMQMTTGLDAGPVLLQRRCPIGDADTAASLHERLAELGATALLEALEDLPARLAAAQPQDETAVTRAPKLDREEGRIDWSRPAAELERRVRALQPWPAAWTLLDGEPLRIWAAQVLAAADPAGAEPGTVLGAGRDGIDVATGEGVLRLLEVQPASRRSMRAADLANARELDRCRLGR
ncbi:MAG: methionyl-tRNA formyltransferase [Halofilum sp. (in: g-proteobacteria)]|nr:methionyl-tRNA formyltransferase [Halofilum sp. (in: g-proteobacteria)]